MQYRLSTLFLIFFVVAASLAAFGVLGIYFSIALFMAALCLHYAKNRKKGAISAVLSILIGIVAPGVYIFYSGDYESARFSHCRNNLKNWYEYLSHYQNKHSHFPAISYCDKTGEAVINWLPMVIMEADQDETGLYSSTWQDRMELYPSSIKQTKQTVIKEFQCPSVAHPLHDCSTDYLAIIGPGTIWRSTGTVKLAGLPESGSRTVIFVEAAKSGVNWAEPFNLTAEEVLENTKASKVPRISTYHPRGVNVLFANGAIRTFPAKMPLSIWRKILGGELPAKDLDHIEALIDPHAPDMVNVSMVPAFFEPGMWGISCGVTVWLISVAWLFYRSVKSRKIIPPASAAAR
jgi:hypothetical protein